MDEIPITFEYMLRKSAQDTHGNAFGEHNTKKTKSPMPIYELSATVPQTVDLGHVSRNNGHPKNVEGRPWSFKGTGMDMGSNGLRYH